MLGETVDLEPYLTDGWEVVGYSVCMMAMGATSHNILLRKGNNLVTCIVGLNGGKEIGRIQHVLSPTPSPQPKKGFFG
jgi:hypothetical protein